MSYGLDPLARPPLSPARQALLDRLRRGETVGVPDLRIPRRPADTTPPPSAHQIGILETLRLFGGLYADVPFRNQSVRAIFDGPLDVAALEWCLSEIGMRHEVLRTTFAVSNDGIRLRIAPTIEVDLAVRDLSDLGEERALGEVRRLCQAELARPMDPEHGPLVVYHLFKVGPEKHVLWLLIDHLLFDGWSFGVLIAELQALYRARTQGRPSPLESLPIQYGDYAAWQAQGLAKAGKSASTEYWRAQLRERPAVVELPTDFPRSEPQPFALASLDVSLGRSAAAAARGFSKSQGLTLFSVLLAGYIAMMWQYSGEEDVSLVSAMANRGRREVQPLMGGFMNGVVLRARLRPDESFLDICQRLRRVVAGAIAHQHIPMGPILEELHPDSDLLRTYFALQSYPVPKLDFPGLDVSLEELNFGTTLWDLTTALTEVGEEIVGRVVFNAHLFKPTTVRRYFDQYQMLLAAALRAPHQPLRLLPMPETKGC